MEEKEVVELGKEDANGKETEKKEEKTGAEKETFKNESYFILIFDFSSFKTFSNLIFKASFITKI